MGLRAVTELPTSERELLKCRAYGHRWEDRGWIAMIRDSVRGYDQELVCDRCQTVRSDFRARGTLTVLSRSYRYPNEDYPGAVKKVSAIADLIAAETQRRPGSPPAEEAS